MKVFKISATARPTFGRFRNYAGLCLQDQDTHIFELIGNGKPFPNPWTGLEFYIENPALPRPDFYGFPGAFVCSERVVEEVGEALEMCSELLPVTIEGEKVNFFLCNVTNCYSALDRERSVWRSFGGKRGVKMLVSPAFNAERFGEGCLFKIPDDGFSNTYCFERTGDAADGEFKPLVERCRFTGLAFELIWES